jgi:Flp pilus assembly protein TadB
MSHKTAIKIYEYSSYVLIIAATVIYFVLKSQGLALTMLLLALAMTMRMLMERHRYRSCEEENDELREDLRKLTLLLAEEKKKRGSSVPDDNKSTNQ